MIDHCEHWWAAWEYTARGAVACRGSASAADESRCLPPLDLNFAYRTKKLYPGSRFELKLNIVGV